MTVLNVEPGLETLDPCPRSQNQVQILDLGSRQAFKEASHSE
jgi:hypothetical protein